MLENFRFSPPLKFFLAPSEPIYLPAYKGSALRGGFGAAFKRTVCLTRLDNTTCAGCLLQEVCPYSYIFETPRINHAGIWRASYDPHPFIIEPPYETRQQYQPGEQLVFNLILIGKGMDYLPYFILSFRTLGRIGLGRGKGRYSLVQVVSSNSLQGKREKQIYDGVSNAITSEWETRSFADIAEEAQGLDRHRLTLRFLTPTRIKYRGKLTSQIDFEIFTRNLLRRLSWLAEVHCGEKWELEWRKLLSKANERVKTINSHLRWYGWQRYSRRQNTRIAMGGFIGEITFEGELAEFLPFIKLGEYLHIGGGTVYGLGKYRITMQGGKYEHSYAGENTEGD